MEMEGMKFLKKIGKWELWYREGSCTLVLTDHWLTNWGMIYSDKISRFKENFNYLKMGEYWRVPQIIGFDWGITKGMKKYIYSLIKKGFFDNLESK